MTAPPAHAASWESGGGGTGVAGGSTARAAEAPPGGSASSRTAEAGGRAPARSPAGLPAAAAATEAIMSHVSGRPSLAPGGLQACEMEQIRGTGSDGSAHAGSGQRPMSEQSPRPPRSLRAATTSGSRAGVRGAPEDRPGPGPGLRTEGRAGPVERGRQNAAEGDRVQACGPDIAPRRAPSLPAKPEPGGLLDPAFPPIPHPRSASEAAPARPAPQTLCVQRSTARDEGLPSPPPPPSGGPPRPPSPPGSALTTPGQLSQVSCLTPAGLGPLPAPQGWGPGLPHTSLHPEQPRAQQGLRKGSVVRLQFIPVETEAQEMREPPCPPPKGTFTARVSFPRPLTLHSHPRLSPPCCLQRPSPPCPLLAPRCSYPRAFARAFLARRFCPPPLLVLQDCREAIATAVSTAACSSPP